MYKFERKDKMQIIFDDDSQMFFNTGFIDELASLLRVGGYVPDRYKNVIIPMMIITRLDYVLKDRKRELLGEIDAFKETKQWDAMSQAEKDEFITTYIDKPFYNISEFICLEDVMSEPQFIKSHFLDYIKGFSKNIKNILNSFKFLDEVNELNKKDILFNVVDNFYRKKDVFDPHNSDDLAMGNMFEGIIRKYYANPTAGQYFTPREIIKLMVNLLIADMDNNKDLFEPETQINILDAACGTGGMLSVAESTLKELFPDIKITLFGQEFSDELQAVCVSDMLIKGQDARIEYVNTLTTDAFPEKKMRYVIMNPPFGLQWKPSGGKGKNEEEKKLNALLEKQLEEINKLSEFVQRAEQASASNHSLKSMGIERAKWLEKKKAELIIPEQELSKVRISFTTECETGKDVLTVTGLSKSFGDTDLFTDVNMNVYKKDRVFILGPNGCGKTTFLRILTNQIVADHGSYSFGANVKLGYFDQSLENLTGGKTVLDEIWDDHPSFTETKVRNYLALFLFRGEDVFKNVDTLSGGEKAKLCLLKLMLSGANLLLLDEPTNHLDIPSREVLEEAIAEYKGTVIAVSHDRYFINKLATRICMMTNEGLKNTIGGYDDYIANLNSEVAKASPKVEPKVNDYKLRKERQSEINRLRGKIKRTEAEIDEFDAKISEINELLSTPEVSADFQKIMELTEEINNLSAKQDELMHNWEECNERLCKLTDE